MPIALKAFFLLGWKVTKERHYDKNEYYVTNVFLYNKKVDIFFLDSCFGESSLQYALRFYFWVFLFGGKSDWIFNNSHTKSLNNMKSPMCTVTQKGLSNNTNCVMRGMIWFGGFQVDKQNKQPFLMDRLFYYPLFHFIFIFVLVMVLSFFGSMLFIFFPILWTHQRLDHP
jgi:hypothetical protein